MCSPEFELPAHLRLDEAGVERAADRLEAIGNHHHWFPKGIPSWRDSGPIEKDEFLAIVEDVVRAYLDLKLPPPQPPSE